MSDAVVAIVSIFFLIGITVGIITVIALPVLRTRRPAQGEPAGPPEQRSSGSPDRDWDWDDPDPGPGPGPGQRPRWPGEAGHGYNGR